MLKKEVRFDVVPRFLRVVLRASFRYPGESAAILLVIITASSLMLTIPYFLQRLVDAVTSTLPSSYTFFGFVVAFVLPISAVRIGSWLTWRVSGFIASDLQTKIESDLTEDAFHGILIHSYRFFSDSFTGSLVRRVQSFGTSFKDVAETVWWEVTPMIVSVVLSIVFLSFRDLAFGGIVVGWIVLLLITNLIFSRLKLPYDRLRASQKTIITGTVADAITNSTNISLFTTREDEERRLSEKIQTWGKTNRFAWRIAETGIVFQNVFNVGCEILIVSFVIWQWFSGTATLGDIVYVQGILLFMFSNTQNMGRAIRRIYEAAADAHEMMDIADMKPEIRDMRGAKELSVKRGVMEFDHVSFAYREGTEVLKDFSLDILARQKVALVGASGSGKTTVTKLLFRFFDIQDGTIKIDGQNIAKVTQDSLRNAIAYVPQEPILFHRTLMENIRYGKRDATDEQVIEAAKLAHCHEFISSSPEGYETLVGERGIKLSGGERQRIAIARAILKDAPILVLDEATSSLDSESESFIQDALKRLMKNKTVIVIAHRLSTVMEMDRIIVMQDGKIVDEGTHDSLRAKVGIYQKLWNIQAGGFQDACGV